MAAAIKKLSRVSGNVRAINLAITHIAYPSIRPVTKLLRYTGSMQPLLFISIGLVSGGLISLIGTGAGLVIIPALVYLAHFSEKTAVGTSLTLLLPPLGLFAAYTYWRHGNVNIRAALWIMLGFLIGSFLLARVANDFSSATLGRIFGVAAILIGLKMLISA